MLLTYNNKSTGAIQLPWEAHDLTGAKFEREILVRIAWCRSFKKPDIQLCNLSFNTIMIKGNQQLTVGTVSNALARSRLITDATFPLSTDQSGNFCEEVDFFEQKPCW